MNGTTRRTVYIRAMSTPTKYICSYNRKMLSPRGCELKFKTCRRCNSITSPQALSLRVMIRPSTVGSRLSVVAAAVSMSKNAKDLTVVASKCRYGVSISCNSADSGSYSNGWACTTPRGHRFLPSLRSFTSTIRPSNQVDRPPLFGYSALPHVAHLKT